MRQRSKSLILNKFYTTEGKMLLILVSKKASVLEYFEQSPHHQLTIWKKQIFIEIYFYKILCTKRYSLLTKLRDKIHTFNPGGLNEKETELNLCGIFSKTRPFTTVSKLINSFFLFFVFFCLLHFIRSLLALKTFKI